MTVTVSAPAYQLVVDSEEGHLTGFIEQVGEGDEGFGLLQVEDQHSSDERHALDLKKPSASAASALKTDRACVFLSRGLSL